GCTRATRSNLITIYDTLLRKRPVWLFGALQAKGKTYSALLNPSVARGEWGDAAASALQDLQRLGAAPAYAFLLWASQVAQSQKWNQGHAVSRFATLLSKWFFWRNLTDRPPTRQLDPLFMELVSHLLPQMRSAETSKLDGFIQQTSGW